MYCKKCFTENEDGEKFCETCGAKLEENLNLDLHEKAKEEAIIQRDFEIKKNRRNITILIVAIVLICGISFLIIANEAGLWKGDKSDTGPEASRARSIVMNEEYTSNNIFFNSTNKITRSQLISNVLDSTEVVTKKYGDSEIVFLVTISGKLKESGEEVSITYKANTVDETCTLFEDPNGLSHDLMSAL